MAPSVGGISRGLPPIGSASCIFAPILQDAAAVPPVSVGIIVCNTHGNAFSCKFSCVSFLVRKFCQFCSPSQVVGCACLAPAAGGRGTRRRCRSPSVRCSARNIGRRATLLPSPRRRSFLPVIVSGWWSPFCSGVLLLRVSRWGFWCSFLLCWVWLYMILFYTVFNRARNKRARTREGLPLLFPASLPSAGLLAAFFFGGRCLGYSLNARKAWRGVSVRFLYLRGHCQKSARA